MGVQDRMGAGMTVLLGALLAAIAVQSAGAAGLPGFVTCTPFAGAAAQLRAARAPGRGRRAGPAMKLPDYLGDFKVGDKVKVVEKDLIFWHIKPKENPDGFKVPEGLEGVVKQLANVEPKSGKEVSPNRPIVVQFTDPKFFAHFEARELEKA